MGVSALRFLAVGWRDVLEIAVSAFVIYRLLLLFRGTRALQMLVGIVVLVLVYAAAWVFKLAMITYLLGLVFTYGAFAALVIFQPELRAALAHLGQSRTMRELRRMETGQVAVQVADAVDALRGAGMGALIAIERGVGLGDYVKTGTPVFARVSSELPDGQEIVSAITRTSAESLNLKEGDAVFAIIKSTEVMIGVNE
jgi:diadenylate cyclase